MDVRYIADPVRYPRMTTAEMRENMLVEHLFAPGKLDMVYCDVDRAIVGSAVPTTKPLELSGVEQLRCDYFCQRRELGVLNLGSSGTVKVDKKDYPLETLDCLYIGMGSQSIRFSSGNSKKPAAFYLLSFPAHQAFPTVKASRKDTQAAHLGSREQANERTIYKYIHPDGIKSCQLCLGFTELEPGCVWNTMPPHTHDRRMEAYLYFGMDENTRVFHIMGPADETRHLVVANRQVVFSPSWSMHAGVGTGKYSFCWGMGGENQTFDDMDHIKMSELK